MVDYQALSIVLTGIGMIIALTYYGLQIRNQNKTRQAQLLMNLMNSYRSPEFRKQWHTLWHLEWSDFQDFREKYEGNTDVMAAWTSVITYFESVGVIAKYNLIDIKMIHSLLAGGIKIVWERYQPLIMGDRELFKQYVIAWDDVEYLYHEIIQYEQQNPELKT